MSEVPPIRSGGPVLAGGRDAALEVLGPAEAPEVWALLPHVALGLGDPGPVSALQTALRCARQALRPLVRSAGPQLFRVGSILVASTSWQNMRVLRPVVEELEGRYGQATRVQLPSLSLKEILGCRRAAAIATRQLGHLLEHLHARVQHDLAEEASQVAVLRARTARLFESDTFTAMLVATQHNAATRSLLVAAHEAGGVRSVYIPHAPVADNDAYRDLPTHFALLRGPAEVDFYLELDGCDGLLCVVGDPSISAEAGSLPPRNGPVVFVGTTGERSELEAMVRVVRDSGIGPIEVAPHPRTKGSVFDGLYPASWRVNQFPSTYERLEREGASLVVQFSSGTGLEALRLGLPVVEMCHRDERPNYPYLKEPEVRIASTSDELHAVANQIDLSGAAAERRVAYANTWCSQVGAPASAAAADAVERCLEGPVPSRLLYDGWR